MNTLQINKILHRNNITKDFYIGCFAADTIPVSINFTPFCMVVNIDPSSAAGSQIL